MKNKIPFGVSTTIVGALKIKNFRIRTNSVRLQSSIEEYISTLHYKSKLQHQLTMSKNGYRMYDFTLAYVCDEELGAFNQTFEHLKKLRLAEKINKLKDEFGEDYFQSAMWQSKRIQRKVEHDAEIVLDL